MALRFFLMIFSDLMILFLLPNTNWKSVRGKLQINKIININFKPLRPMRPSSQRQYSNSAQKPTFQTKLKNRPGADNDLQKLNASIDTSRMSRTQRSFHNHDECIVKDDIFNKTASLLSNTNFSHHHQDKCVCNDCHCGRHLCKLHVIKPDLTKNTIYQRSFYEQSAIPNIVNHDK